MTQRRFLLSLLLITFMLTACGNGDDDKKKSDPTTPPTAEPTSLPAPTPTEDTEPSITDTPMDTADLPAIELLAGAANSCVITEGYSELVGYDAVFYETTTKNPVIARLVDADGNVLADESYQGENKDGEEGWGWYPPVYEVPEDTALTIEITVYLSEADDAPITSFTSLTYNCTSGETLDQTFIRNP